MDDSLNAPRISWRWRTLTEYTPY